MKNTTIANLVKGGLALGGLAVGAIIGTFVKAAPEETIIDIEDVTADVAVEVPDVEVQDV